MFAGTGRDDLAVLGLHAISAAGRHVSHRRRSPITSGVRSGPPATWWTCRSVGAVPIVASTPTTVDALSRGVTQVVAVGAGYDGRAPRYRMPGVRWWEVDRPRTQEDRRARLARLAIATDHVAQLGLDLADGGPARSRARGGSRPRCRGTTVAESSRCVCRQLHLKQARSPPIAGRSHSGDVAWRRPKPPIVTVGSSVPRRSAMSTPTLGPFCTWALATSCRSRTRCFSPRCGGARRPRRSRSVARRPTRVAPVRRRAATGYRRRGRPGG